MPLYLKTSTATNSWRKAASLYLKTSIATNSWRKVVSAFIKTADGWQLIFGVVGPQIETPLTISSNSTSYPATLTGRNYHWDSGTTFTSKFQKSSSSNGLWSDITTFENILNPSSGSSNTKTLILLESHFILNQPSTFFRFVVRAQDSVSGRETIEFSSPIEISVPDAVMSHTGDPIVATSTTISIPFTYNFALEYYIVETYDASGLVSSTTVNTPSSPIVVEDLTPETTYDIVIYPYNFVDMVGIALLGIGITTLAGVPGPVILLTRSTGNGGSKTFTWSAPTTGGAVASYEYQLNSFGFINNGSLTSVSLTGLSGTNTFQVRAVNSSGNGTSVSTGSFIIPTINSGPTAGSITSSSATISWTSSNQSSYSLSVPGASGTPYTGTTATSRFLFLSESTSYTPTLTITSSTNDTATTQGSQFTTPAATVPPSGGTVSVNPTTGIAGSTTFTASTSGWTGTAPITFAYSWQYFNNSFQWIPIATGTTFAPTLAQNATALAWRVVVTATNTAGSATATGSFTVNNPQPALIPTFGPNTSTTGGFFGSVTNYDANYTWGISASIGTVTWSSPSGSTRAFTVSGLSAGQSSTVTVTTSRTGYNNGSAQTTGSASAPVLYTVTWNANGGSVSPSSNTVNAGASVTPPTPTRSGYTFNYWRNPLSGGDPIIIYAGVPYTPTGNITFYAIWTLNVSIPSGGSVSLTGGSTAGSVITASTSGWSGSPTSYDVYITTALSPNIPTSSSSRVASSGGGSSTTYTITSFDTVSPVNIFRAFATASNSAGTSGVVQSSNTITAQSSGSVPAVPTGLNNVYNGGTSYTFSWTAVSGATSYQIIPVHALSAAGASASEKTSRNFTSGSTYDSSVDGGNSSTYVSFKVRATNSFGSSVYSAIYTPYR